MKELKNKFYRETEFLIGDPFKNHSRDAIWTWIEDKLSRPVQPQVIKKNAEVEEMQKELGILKTENEKLKFMIDNGLGWQDMINDISYPPRD